MAPDTLEAHLREAPFALAMSSGFFSFFAHTGFLRALERRGLQPASVAGSSAGALVAGLWASGLDAEALAGELLALDRHEFWDPAPGFGLLRGAKFHSKVRKLVRDTRIEDCRVPVRISIFDIATRKTTVVTRGALADAICASCAVPLFFQPVRVEGRLSWDGGVLDRPGIAEHPPGRLLYHHIASRSPWRRPGSSSLAIPARDGLVALQIQDLPRSGPFALAAGRAALRAAEAATERALDGAVRPLITVAA